MALLVLIFQAYMNALVVWLGVSSWYSLQTFHVYILGDNISASSFFVFFPVQRTPYQNAYMDALGIYECASYLHSFGDESCFSFKI